MTFFKNLFGSRKSNVQLEENTPQLEVKEELFVNHTDPNFQPEPKAKRTYKEKLDGILGRDYETLGYRDAVNYANDVIIQKFENRLITEVVNVLEDEVTVVQAKLAHMQAMENEEGNELTQQKLKIQIALLKKQEDNLYQKVLDVREKKGIVETALLDYQLGFQRGYTDYIQQIGE